MTDSSWDGCRQWVAENDLRCVEDPRLKILMTLSFMNAQNQPCHIVEIICQCNLDECDKEQPKALYDWHCVGSRPSYSSMFLQVVHPGSFWFGLWIYQVHAGVIDPVHLVHQAHPNSGKDFDAPSWTRIRCHLSLNVHTPTCDHWTGNIIHMDTILCQVHHPTKLGSRTKNSGQGWLHCWLWLLWCQSGLVVICILYRGDMKEILWYWSNM